MNAVGPRVISHYAAGPARWAATAAAGVSAGHGQRVPFAAVVLALLLGALGFGMARMRRGRRAREQHDDWGRREPPAPAPQATPPASAMPPAPSALAVSPAAPDAAPDGDTSAAPARTPRRAVSFERPAGGWAVETHGLTKRFGATVAVGDVELLVPRGCAFGYLGPNGAGKTTLIRTLLGLTRADGGTMSLLGIPVPAGGAGPWPGSARSSTSPCSIPT